LRPELVKKSVVPLSSDVFSPFGRIDKETHEEEARDIFYKLK
jgi:hypothetical protein